MADPAPTNWNKNNRACKTTWLTLLLLDQHQSAFAQAGAIKMEQLTYWSVAGAPTSGRYGPKLSSISSITTLGWCGVPNSSRALMSLPRKPRYAVCSSTASRTLVGHVDVTQPSSRRPFAITRNQSFGSSQVSVTGPLDGLQRGAPVSERALRELLHRKTAVRPKGFKRLFGWMAVQVLTEYWRRGMAPSKPKAVRSRHTTIPVKRQTRANSAAE